MIDDTASSAPATGSPPQPLRTPAVRTGARRVLAWLTGSALLRDVLVRLGEIRADQRHEAQWRASVQKQMSALVRQHKALLREVRDHRREDARWRWRFRRQLEAIIRREAVAGTDISAPNWLPAQRFRLRSQYEEDGILIALLRAAGVTSRRFVEIGCGKNGGNSAMLAFDFGWSGLMVDAAGGKVESLRRALAFNRAVTVVKGFVTPDNINSLLKQHGAAGEIDFMSIDVDSIDYWLLDALDVCAPRILVMEYNAHFGPDRAVTLPPRGLPESRPRGYFGASLAALEKKAREKGYRLVLCEDAGVNAFFLRHDVAPDIPGLTPAAAFRASTGGVDPNEPVQESIDLYSLVAEHDLPLVEV